MRLRALCALLFLVGAAPVVRAEDEMPAPSAVPVEQVEGETESMILWETPPAYQVAEAEMATAPADAPAEKAETKRPTASANIILPRPRPLIPGINLPDDAEIPIVDTDESLPLPAYPAGALTAIGEEKNYTLGEEDTLLDVARYFKLGFVELRAANPKMDAWTPVPGDNVVIPSFKLLPRAPQKGIVVNLAQMRMYVFRTPGKPPVTFPIGIGREGLLTPTGETTIVRKMADPVWHPTPRMKEEKPYLPDAIGPGNQNPLGSHALYLGWPEYLIHGTNKPWAIGRRVSSGCMRLYPEDTKAIYEMIAVGTPVTVVDQPLLVAWKGGKLYFEANPSKSQSNDIEINGEHENKDLTDATRKVIVDAAGISADHIDWSVVKDAMRERRGVPVVIAVSEKAQSAGEDTADAPADDDDETQSDVRYN